MPRKLRPLMRLGGIVILGVALLGNLPGLWAAVTGVVGAVMFFAAGPA